MSKGNRNKGPRKGRPRLDKKDKSKPVTMRLHPTTISARSMLAKAWGCDKTRAVEECIGLAFARAMVGALPPLAHRPALDGPAREAAK